MTPKSDLLPRDRPKVIDLVRETGIDVSPWSWSKRGEKGASTNPHYCYEWAFVQPGAFVVLNIWHHDIEDRDGALSQRLNPREHAERLDGQRNGGAIAARARRMDDAIRTAVKDHLPIRVIIVSGGTSEADHVEGEPLKVRGRMLDPIPWAVSSYDPETGECLITRGASPDPYVDQFSPISLETFLEAPPERRETHGQAFVRSEEVRRQVRLRAQGRCEWCGVEGFRTESGAIYLETHHIIPLSEGGIDHPANVVAICPNHHREAHHGEGWKDMRRELANRITSRGMHYYPRN